METEHSCPASIADNGSRRFVVNLVAQQNGAPEVRSCELTSRSFRNRTSFQDTTSIDEIFVDSVARAIYECLSKREEGTGIVSLPSYFLEIPGLVLAGASVMSTQKANGDVNIILRFKLVMGAVNRAFRPDIGFDGGIEDQNARLAASVLADISLPLLNFCTAADLGLIQDGVGLAQFVQRLKERSEEIKFQIELVKRFIEQCHQDDADGARGGSGRSDPAHSDRLHGDRLHGQPMRNEPAHTEPSRMGRGVVLDHTAEEVGQPEVALLPGPKLSIV